MNIPGTVIPAEQGSGPGGAGFLAGIFAATSGLMLSQVREITGLDAPALQNWVKRGWVPPAVGKKYNIDQVARILIINMLRDVMQLERIDHLLAYINGKADDKSDDIISEPVLYEYICGLIASCEGLDIREDSVLDERIDRCMQSYAPPHDEAGAKLRRALAVIMLAFRCAQIKKKAEQLMQALDA